MLYVVVTVTGPKSGLLKSILNAKIWHVICLRQRNNASIFTRLIAFQQIDYHTLPSRLQKAVLSKVAVMPPRTRSKRVFAEISPNPRSEPAPKRKSTRRASDENNNAPSVKPTPRSHLSNCALSLSSQRLQLTEPSEANGKVSQGNHGNHSNKQNHQGRFECSPEDLGLYLRGRGSTPMQCITGLHVHETRGREQGYPWIIIKKGADLYKEWRLDQWKRDAEAMDVVTYTDYSGYGTGEVVENMVLHPLLLLLETIS